MSCVPALSHRWLSLHLCACTLFGVACRLRACWRAPIAPLDAAWSRVHNSCACQQRLRPNAFVSAFLLFPSYAHRMLLPGHNVTAATGCKRPKVGSTITSSRAASHVPVTDAFHLDASFNGDGRSGMFHAKDFTYTKDELLGCPRCRLLSHLQLLPFPARFGSPHGQCLSRCLAAMKKCS